MKKLFISAIAISLPCLLMAQTAFDSYQLSRYDLRGTARYMSMAGAFGALGGDLSAINQNPGGIGVYRKSDVGITLDINLHGSNFNSTLGNNKENFTKALLPNIGYVGATMTGSEIMPVFNWGFSYGRTASFNRRYTGTVDLNNSLSNYIAGYTTAEAWTNNELSSNDQNYWDNSHAPWSSILAYNTYLINPVRAGSTTYNGLWKNGETFGVADAQIEESGYIDEYEMSLGGNISDVVYWGIGVGITDLQYNRSSLYQEFLDYAQLPELDSNGEPVSGSAQSIGSDTGFDWESHKSISGTGFNFKAGVIVRPINELRLGFAIHTPTYYNLTESTWGYARTYYGYEYDPASDTYSLSDDVWVRSPIDEYNWKLRTPWRMMFSAAGVIGSKGIISVDYEYRPYQNMTTKSDYVNCDYINNDIKTYYKAANILRLGAEYRFSSNFSLRAGYAVETSGTTQEIKDNKTMMYLSNPFDTGTDHSYTLDNATQYITLGLGYKYKGFYADAAYVHKSVSSDFHSGTSYTDEFTGNWITPAGAEIKTNDNNIVLSVGYRF